MSEWNQIDAGMLSRMATLNSIYRQNDSKPVSGFDPYQAMLRRKQANVPNEDGYINAEVQQYDPKDIQALEEFCQQYGIMGFNFGRMNPKSALQMLKNKMGIVEKTYNKKMLLD